MRRLLLLLAASLAACSTPAPTPSPTASSFPVTLRDDSGASVTVAAPPQRIVSLAPSDTQVLFALGVGSRVVADDSYSTYPAAAGALPHISTYPKIDAEAVVALRPDLVITSFEGSNGVQPLTAAGLVVAQVNPGRLDDVYRTVGTIGELVGARAAAAQLVISLRSQLAQVASRVRGAPSVRVYFELDATNPSLLYTVGPGSYIDDLIRLAGGTNIAAGTGQPYPAISPEAVVAGDPQVILLADGDFGATPTSVGQRPGWGRLSAVREQRVLEVDPSLFSQPGPRLPLAAKTLAHLLHPDLVPPP